MRSSNQYERLYKAKHLLDSDIDGIADTREDSCVIQPRNSNGNPNVKETGTPQNKRVGVDVKDQNKLFVSNPKKTGQEILDILSKPNPDYRNIPIILSKRLIKAAIDCGLIKENKFGSWDVVADKLLNEKQN